MPPLQRLLEPQARLGKAIVIAGLCAAASFGPAYAQDQSLVTAAVGMDVTTTDPHKISGGGEYLFFSNVFEGLYGHDLEGNLVPQLATDYEVSEDGKTWTFNLREGVTFHNGEAFTADDVKFSWTRAIDPDLKNPRASILASNIEDVEIVDDFTVRLKLKEADGALLENLGEYWYMVPADLVREVGNDEYSGMAVGTGPWKFVSRRINESIELEAFKDHWGRTPKVDKLTLLVAPDPQTRIAMLQTGQADIIVNVPPHLAESIDSSPDTRIIKRQGFQNIYVNIGTRNSNGAWVSKKRRQALNYAVDKQAIVDKVMFGYATISAAPCAIGVLGCDIGKEPYPYDPEKARQMLEEDGFDFDRTYKFVGLAPGRTPQSKEVTEAIAFYLGEVGVKTEIEIMEYGAWLAFLRGHAFDDADFIFWTWTDYNNDPMGRLPRSVVTDATYSWDSRESLDKSVTAAAKIVDREERTEALRAIFTELYEDPPFINLWTVDNLYGVRSDIDWTPRKNISWPVFWSLSRKG